MKRCLLIANGDIPSKKEVSYLSSIGYDTLFCADGGANSVYKMGLIPDYIVGDFDSILPEVYDYYVDRCRVIQIKRQNDTDVEKCLKTAIKKKFEEVILLGSTGDRLDHTFCNLGIVLKFFDDIRIKIVHQKSILCAYRGNVTLKTIPGETISIYGISPNTKFISSGLKYPLENFPLPFGVRESTSNIAAGEKVELKIKNGKAFVIREYQALKKYGLIQYC